MTGDTTPTLTARQFGRLFRAMRRDGFSPTIASQWLRDRVDRDTRLTVIDELFTN